MTLDPVCCEEVDELTSAVQMNYQGKLYCFCSERCCKCFELEPARYLDELTVSVFIHAV